MKNKHVGYLVIGISLLILAIVYSFNQALAKIVAESCSHGVTCPMYSTLTFQKAISYILTIVVAVVGVIIAFVIKEQPVQQIHIHNTANKKNTFPSKQEQEELLKSLDVDEQKVLKCIFEKEGSVYQSKLVSSLNLTKVKVTRILDSLEGKGLVERKRRGMTNMVVLKNTK